MNAHKNRLNRKNRESDLSLQIEEQKQKISKTTKGAKKGPEDTEVEAEA